MSQFTTACIPSDTLWIVTTCQGRVLECTVSVEQCSSEDTKPRPTLSPSIFGTFEFKSNLVAVECSLGLNLLLCHLVEEYLFYCIKLVSYPRALFEVLWGIVSCHVVLL